MNPESIEIMEKHGYNYLNKLGEGAFGVTLKAKNVSNKDIDKIVAIKIIDRTKLPKHMKKFYDREKEISLKLKHVNLMRTFDFFENKKYGFLVSEFCSGGEIQHFLDLYFKKNNKGFPEDYVQHLMRQIVNGIKCMHENNYIHRDLKLENIMLNFKTEEDKNELNMLNATVKIIDFGFARHLDEGEFAESICGTVPYMDPIILKRYVREDRDKSKYGYEADIWSLGVICYQMLMGVWPFYATNIKDFKKKLDEGKYKMPSFLSVVTISFINSMLQKDPKKRANIKMLAKHDFLIKDLSKSNRILLMQSVAFDITDEGNGFWLAKGKKEEGGSNVDLTEMGKEENYTPSLKSIEEANSTLEKTSREKTDSGKNESDKKISNFEDKKEEEKEEEEEKHYFNEDDDENNEEKHYLNDEDESDFDIDKEIKNGFYIMNSDLVYTKPKLLGFIPGVDESSISKLNE